LIEHEIIYDTPAWLLALVLLVVLSAAIELGFRVGKRHRSSSDTAATGAGTMEAAVFGLFGLLLALSFSFVVSRSEERRHLMVQEANAIGTAYLRCDIAPDALRTELRSEMREYVDQRVALAEAGSDDVRAAAVAKSANVLQGKIWGGAVGLVRAHPDGDAYALLVEAMNEMFDMQSARDAAMRAHLPTAVLVFLALTAAVAAVVAGYTLGLAGERHGLASSCFVVLTVLVAFTIVDMDRPRSGLFRAPVGMLVQLQAQMKEGPP